MKRIEPGAASPGAGPRIVSITAPQAYDLRRRVLRAGTPSSVVEFVGDHDPTTHHLGVELDGVIVAITTWIDQHSPDEPELVGEQLRGMATDPAAHVRGRGFGAMVLTHGIERAAERGADVVWANARDSALGFYLAHGFVVSSDGFTTSDTVLPHHRIIRHLR